MLDLAHSVRMFPPMPFLQWLDRLWLLDSASQVQPIDAPADVEAAIARLLAAGLVGRASRDPLHLLFGGKSKSRDSGITVYQEGFMISRERDGRLLAGVAGPGNLSESAYVRTLHEATDFVMGVYSARRTGA